MKANRKFVDGEEAVSAVIGVILMVAITVAIAATVYVYVSGMLSPSPSRATNIAGTVSTNSTQISIKLSGEYLQPDDCRVTVTDPSGTVAEISDVAEGTNSFDSGALSNYRFLWIDQSADDKIGAGDLIKVNTTSPGTNTFSSLGDDGTWYVQLIEKSNGKPAFDSDAIDVS